MARAGECLASEAGAAGDSRRAASGTHAGRQFWYESCQRRGPDARLWPLRRTLAWRLHSVRHLTAHQSLPWVIHPKFAVFLAERRWPVEPAVTTLAILLLALVVRLPFFLESDFPLNDGGMFFVMAREIASAHFALPATTSYNGDAI